MYKKLFVLLMLLCVMPAHAGDLKSFDAIVKAFDSNKSFKFVTHIDQCAPKHPITMIGMFTPSAIFVVGDKLYASDYHFIIRKLGGKNKSDQSVYEYVRYTLEHNGTMNLAMTVLDSRNGAELTKLQSTCHLGEGFKVFVG